MSKQNVNPDHYKVAGRERQGEDVIHEVERREEKRLRSQERSTAQKGADTRHAHDSTPSSNRVSGDVGRQVTNDEPEGGTS